jgi:hypothetical protein
MIKVLDRDGVLLGTCGANLAAYSQASKEVGISFDETKLEESIHGGESVNDFRVPVWGEISEREFAQVKKVKVGLFTKLLPLVQVNAVWVEEILNSPGNFYLATKASVESTHFLIQQLVPEFRISHIFSTQDPKYFSKVDILKSISKFQNASTGDLILYDDSLQTIQLVTGAGFQAELSPHFCGV